MCLSAARTVKSQDHFPTVANCCDAIVALTMQINKGKLLLTVLWAGQIMRLGKTAIYVVSKDVMNFKQSSQYNGSVSFWETKYQTHVFTIADTPRQSL